MILLMCGVNLSIAQWTRTNIPGVIVYSFAFSDTNLFAGTSGGVYRSTNNGASWKAANSGLPNAYVYSLAFNGKNLFAGTNGYGIFVSTNNGASWTLPFLGLESNEIYSLAISGSNIFAGIDGDVMLSTDNGKNWTPLNIFNGYLSTNVYALAVIGTNLFAGTYGNGVFLSTNNGSNWTAVNSGLLNFDVQCLVVSGNDLLAGTDGDGIFLSYNNGTSWKDVNTGLGNNSILSLAVGGTNLFAGTNTEYYVGRIDDGVFLSTNHESWSGVNLGLRNSPIESGLANFAIPSLAVINTYIYAGTDSGVWRRPLSDMIPTSVEQPLNNLPTKFTLQQNYPDPFNPTTQISYTLAKASNVSLKIYDVLGQLVATLVNSKTEPGEHFVSWNALNVPSGVYFYRIVAGDFVQTKKMVLMK